MDEILHTINTWEGGLSNDPADAGGLTKYGISKQAYPNLDIENLTKEEAVQIYLRDYWNPLSLDAINSKRVRWKTFDIGVNMGPVRAALILQGCVGVTPDAVVGSATIGAVNSMNELELLVKLAKSQVLRYARIVASKPSQITFLVGWVNRAMDLGESLT